MLLSLILLFPLGKETELNLELNEHKIRIP